MLKIVQLEIRRKYRLLTLRRTPARPLDRCDLQSTPVADVVFAFAQILIGVLCLLKGRLFLQARNQNTKIERMHLKRDIVLGLLEVVFGGRRPPPPRSDSCCNECG